MALAADRRFLCLGGAAAAVLAAARHSRDRRTRAADEGGPPLQPATSTYGPSCRLSFRGRSQAQMAVMLRQMFQDQPRLLLLELKICEVANTAGLQVG